MYCYKIEYIGFMDIVFYMVIVLEYDRNVELYWINLVKILKNLYEI